MLPNIDGLTKRLGELRAIELQLADYQQLYADENELTIGKGPVVIFDAVEVRLTGITQVTAVLDALLRSVEIQAALLSAQLARIERRPKAKPKAGGNGIEGDQWDAVEP
ncbi:MAG: hypothetical protein JWO64_2636 [Hyphomicrobiales bacterium]|jgi:hypothetical protein|nr:hypothetical protein [Hyphomicrobiales bacterium]